MNSITTPKSTSKFDLSTLSPSKVYDGTFGKRIFLNADKELVLLKTSPLELKYGLSHWNTNGKSSYSLNAYSDIDFFRSLETRVQEIVAENSKAWLKMENLTPQMIEDLSIMYPVVKTGKSGDNVKFNFPISENEIFSTKVHNSENVCLELTTDNYKTVLPKCSGRVCFGVSLFINKAKKVSVSLTAQLVKITEVKTIQTLNYSDVFSDSD